MSVRCHHDTPEPAKLNDLLRHRRVLSAALAWRARTALLKAVCMMGFGLFVLGRALWSVWHGAPLDAATMGMIGTLALVANMRSVWLCSRNDAIGNLAVMAAALGVLGTGSAWPDLAVAAIMATLALQGGWAVMQQARNELVEGKHDHGYDHKHSH